MTHKQLQVKRARKVAARENRHRIWRDRHPGHASTTKKAGPGYRARWKAGTKIRGNRDTRCRRGLKPKLRPRVGSDDVSYYL